MRLSATVYLGAACLCCTLLNGGQQQVLADLTEKLRRYETIHPSSVIGSSFSRSKRSTAHHYQKPSAIERLEVNTSEGRRLKLLLTENKDILGPSFSVSIVRGNGKEEPLNYNPDIFYTGVVEGEAGSQVFLHWETDNAITAKIELQSETYYIEPSHPHLPHSSNYTMIAYKASDLLHGDQTGSHCGGVKPGVHMNEEDIQKYSDDAHKVLNLTLPVDDKSQSRKKRQSDSSGERNTCGLLVVIDTKFLTGITNGDTDRATNYVVDLIGRVNGIYRKTYFGDNYGYGFQIEQIKIHDTYSNDSDHYNYGKRNVDANTEPNPVNVLLDITFDNRTCRTLSCNATKSSNCIAPNCDEKQMLNAFGRVDKTGNTDYTQFCLAHLFTAYSFKNGVLGLAYIASSSRSTYGGICSKSYYDSSLGAQIYLNTGWSSALNRNGNKILTQEAEIVLAHELGHNFGSEHDPDNSECAPSGGDGKYIMFTYSVDGNSINNNKFSGCSRRSIGQVLNSKSGQCFKQMTSPTRGNYHRDEGEDCDAGIAGDLCCTPQFKYTTGSDCSITNDVCCKDCSIRKADGKPCSSESDFTCMKETTCDGFSTTCIPEYRNPGTTCQDNYGRCLPRNGRTKCVQFPEVVNLPKCICAEEENECKLCFYNPQGRCVPFKPSSVDEYQEDCNAAANVCKTKSRRETIVRYTDADLNQGQAKNMVILVDSTCRNGGLCDADAKCQERQSTDIVARFWNFLSHLNPNTVVEFMKSNIVGTVAIFSFILWLPCAIVVYCYDKKQAKKAALEESAFRSIRRHNDDRRMFNRPLMH